LLLTTRTPALVQIEPAWARVRNVLALRFPDGTVVQDTSEPRVSAATRMYDGREIPGWVICPARRQPHAIKPGDVGGHPRE
jgi:hypothetical protein